MLIPSARLAARHHWTYRQLSTSVARRMRIVPVPVRSDNYAYLVVDEATKEAAAVDPYDMVKVNEAAETEGVHIVANLTTHHHYDHSGGNSAFAQQYKDAPIFAGSKTGSDIATVKKDKDEFTISKNLRVKCLATPCHTQDSICYYITDDSASQQPGVVFTGDTLFIGGCGRFFEGNAPQMRAALTYLGTLPDSTLVYNGHEYTKSNLKFAKAIEPNSQGVARLEKLVQENEVTTGKSTIGDEKDWNVFMRLESQEVLDSIGAKSGTAPDEVMDVLRTKKNNS